LQQQHLLAVQPPAIPCHRFRSGDDSTSDGERRISHKKASSCRFDGRISESKPPESFEAKSSNGAVSPVFAAHAAKFSLYSGLNAALAWVGEGMLHHLSPGKIWLFLNKP